MKRYKRKITLFIFALCIIFIWMLVWSIDLYYDRVCLRDCMRPFELYVRSNGTFPENEQELIDCKYIRKKGDNGGYKYSYNNDGNVYWCDLRRFENYKYEYGILFEDLTVEDGILVDKKNKKPVYLVAGRGMYYSMNRNCYEIYSRRLFELATKGELEVSKKYGRYQLNIYRAVVKGYYEILKDGKEVYSDFGYSYQIATEGEFYPTKDGELLFRKDVTGDDIPDLVIGHWTGRTNPVTYTVFSLGDEFEMAAMKTVELGGRFADVDSDGVYEIITSDQSYRFLGGWSYTMSPAPEVILRYNEGEYVVAVDLMEKDRPSKKDVDDIVAEIGKSDTWKNNGGPKYLYQVMLDLVYSGNIESAWEVFDRSWPEGREGKQEAKDKFIDVLETSKYYGKGWTEGKVKRNS